MTNINLCNHGLWGNSGIVWKAHSDVLIISPKSGITRRISPPLL
jgi:hypothetical protein